MAKIFPTAPSPLAQATCFQQLVEDAASCGSPKGIRAQYQQYEDLLVAEKDQRITRIAVACVTIVQATRLVPAVKAAGESCATPANV